ncbi:MAG: cyanophycin synthetase, partial [Myxococcota bacterium]
MSLYKQQLAWLFGLRRGGGERTLDGMRALWNALGRPCAGLPCIQVGGTNGKGSTAACCAAILNASSRRVGLFSSPHLIDFRERFRINGQMLPQSAVSEAIASVRDAAQTTGYPPLFFEITTATALLLFAQQEVDALVLEVGVGGRLDATTVFPATASIVVSVGMDHCEYLGYSLTEIATNKAGILRTGKPVWLGAMRSEVKRVFVEQAQRTESGPVRVYGEDFWVEGGSSGTFRYCNQVQQSIDFRSPLLGAFQKINMGLAIDCLQTWMNAPETLFANSGSSTAALEQVSLQAHHQEAKRFADAVRQGLCDVRWPGRMQRIEVEGRTWILDGAHNPDAMEQLCAEFEHESVVVLLGVMRPKALRELLTPIRRIAKRVVCYAPNNPRAYTADEVLEAVRFLDQKEQAMSVQTLTQVWEWIQRQASETPVL